MTTLAEDENNDIFLDASGNLATATGLEQCRQNCIAAMEVVLGECVLDLQHGNPYDQTMWSRYLPRAFETAARKSLLAVLNTVSVLSFIITKSGDQANYEAVIQTTFGQNIVVSGVIPNV